MPVIPGVVVPPPTLVSSVLTTMPGADEVARRHIGDVLRLCSLSDQVVELAGLLVRETVGHLMAVGQGPFGLAAEVTSATATVSVTGPGDLFDGFVIDPAGSGHAAHEAQLSSGVRRGDDTTSAWFSLALDGAASAEPVVGVRAGAGGAWEERRSGLRHETLVRITAALAEAETLAAVSDGVTGAVRAHLGAVFTGIALLDPLAVGYLRYVSMDPLPAQTARDWTEIPLDDTSPVAAAVTHGRPIYLDSLAHAEGSFPGIGEHMRVAGVASMAHVPLSVDDRRIGTLAVSWAEEHLIDVDERALLATVAAYTAVAVDRCRAGGRATPAGPAAPATTSAAAAVVDRPLRVLLVDDTDDIRELLTGLFARRADVHVVAGARDGQEGIELAAALQPDIVVLDVAMPVLDGISALPRLVAAAPHARIVMLSALPADLRAPVALESGAMAYVEKTTAVATLVDDLLEGAQLLDAAVRRLSEQVDQQLDADPRQIRLARHFVADTLDRWQQSPLADTIVLLLSELVTNAVLHARSAPRVSVRLLPDRVHVEVTDEDPHVAQALPPTSDDTSGRGLAIVEALSMAWGTALLSQGKVVWFDVARES